MLIANTFHSCYRGISENHFTVSFKWFHHNNYKILILFLRWLKLNFLKMNYLYFTFIAICFLHRCVYVSVIQFSQWNSLWLFEFTGASVLSILYTKYNVPIIKGIHHRFHGILGVVMVSGEKEVSTLPCQATCWILFSFDLFFSLDYSYSFSTHFCSIPTTTNIHQEPTVPDIVLSILNLLYLLILKKLLWSTIFLFL